jgi:hypothetical protein
MADRLLVELVAATSWPRYMMNSRLKIGQCLVLLAVIATPAFQLSVDWYFLGHYHVFSESWPAHAKYHLIVYHLTLVLFAAAAAYRCLAVSHGKYGVIIPLLAVIGFWIPYYLAGLFPMTSFYASPNEPVPGQLIVGVILIVLAAIGWALTQQGRYTVPEGKR